MDNVDIKPLGRVWLYALAGIILVYLVLPGIMIVPMSFSGSSYLDFPPETWSLRWYERLITALNWSNGLKVSLQAAVATTLLATPIGVAAAYGLHVGEHPLFRQARTILMLPLIVPHIIIAIGVFYVYVRLDVLGSFISLVVAHTLLAVPFVIVTTTSALRSFDMSQEMVARSLGCGRLEAFLKVTLPQIKGGVFSGMLFSFVTSMDEVVVSLFVATGTNQTVTKVMFASLRDELDPTIAAVSVVLIALSGLAALAVASAGWINSWQNNAKRAKDAASQEDLGRA